MAINLNEEDIDIKEDSDPKDENIGPWIYKDPFRTPDGGYDQYGLKPYCKERVFCKTGYKATSCKTPIQCVKSGGRRTKRKSRKRKSRRR